MNKRLLSLLHPGGFRFFLALAVLVSHSCRFDPGYWAVFTFFILSGYWIHRMWSRRYRDCNSPVTTFLGSRLLRILPVFWLVNLVSAVVLALGLEPAFSGDTLTHWGWARALVAHVFLLGYADLPHLQGGLRVAWSLDVELQFYLLFPVAFYLCTTVRARVAWQIVFLLAAVAGLAAFLVPVEMGSRNLTGFGLFFLVGAAAAHREWKPGDRLATASLFLALAVVAVCWSVPEWRLLFENEKHGSNLDFTHYKRISQAGLALLSAPLALYTVHAPSDQRDRLWGEFTFILYLVHWPIMMVHGHFFEQLRPARRLPSLAVAWLLIAALSWLVFRYIDQPLERWRRRMVESRLVRRPAPPARPAGMTAGPG